jgi:hypothetical protein
MFSFYRLLVSLSVFALSCCSVAAQNEEHLQGCGNKGVSPWLKSYRARMGHTAPKGSDTAWLYVPCTFHITGTNSGIGYYDLASAFADLCNMNAQFEEARIRFYLVPGDAVRYHDNTTWHNHEWEGGAELIKENNIPDRFNIYIVQNPAGACGYSWLDAVVMGKGCSGPGNGTWAHEAGHHFSLPHTFSGWEDTTPNYNQSAPETINGWKVEKTDGSNCYEAGDLFCDTKPDYLSFRWSCTDNLESSQIQRDPNGVQFRSNAQWFMSYSLDACMRSFSSEQIAAMRENLRTEHASYLQGDAPQSEIPDTAYVRLISPVDSQIVRYADIPLRWSSVPNASYYHVEIFLHSSMNTRLFSKVVYKDTSLIVPKIINNRVVFWRVRAYSESDLCPLKEKEQRGVFQTRNLLAVNELEQSLTLEVSPNPVVDRATLSVETDKNMEVRLQITSLEGRVVFEKIASLYAGENQIAVWADHLPEGIYLLTLSNDRGTLVRCLAVGR